MDQAKNISYSREKLVLPGTSWRRLRIHHHRWLNMILEVKKRLFVNVVREASINEIATLLSVVGEKPNHRR